MGHGQSGPSYQAWRARHWLLIPGGVLAVLLMGSLGFQEYARGRHGSETLLSSLYSTLQLFILHTPHLEGPIPWSLEGARFLAPIVVGYGAILAWLSGVRHMVRVGRLGFVRDHMIICGLSHKALLLVRACRASGERVVVVESNPSNLHLADAYSAGATVLYGDARDPKLLARARIARARRLVALTQDDAANIEIAMRAARLGPAAGHIAASGDLPIFVHVGDPDLRAALHRRESARSAGRRLNIIGIDPYATSARLLFREHPIDDIAIIEHDSRRLHVLIVHFGQMGEAVLAQVARIAHLANGLRPRVTVFHDPASPRSSPDTALRGIPHVRQVCEVEFAGDRPGDTSLQERVCTLAREPGFVTTIILCHPEDSVNLSFALDLAGALGPGHPSIRVRMASRSGLAAMLFDAEVGTLIDPGIHPFGMIEDVFEPDVLLNDGLDRLARQIHEEFVRQALAQGRRPEADPGVRPWVRLAEGFRDSCRQQADHIPVKLRALGYRDVPAVDGMLAIRQFEDSEVELLARMEHARWCAERILAGWSHAPGKKDTARRTSPFLVPWSELDEPTREYDRATVRLIPSLLESIGRRVVRG